MFAAVHIALCTAAPDAWCTSCRICGDFERFWYGGEAPQGDALSPSAVDDPNTVGERLQNQRLAAGSHLSRPARQCTHPDRDRDMDPHRSAPPAEPMPDTHADANSQTRQGAVPNPVVLAWPGVAAPIRTL